MSAIGIFDSGLGGLTVLNVLSKKFPNESFCYLGDIARLPYGNKSPETIRKYGLQIMEFLYQQKVKAIIIACNSASSAFLGETSYKGIPLLNVIEPGAEAALRVSVDKKIAVLGTTATIASHAYERVLKTLDSSVSVIEQACPLFVPLVEEGFVHDHVTQEIAQRYLKIVKEQSYQTVILGCTHYPVLKADLQKVLGESVSLIESGEVLAEKITQMINEKLVVPSTENQRSIRLCITDVTIQFERLAQQLMDGQQLLPLEKVVL